ncbi:MAG: hypothetical protein LQ339_006271 [Xanthoria mediterranea]|nr:MAG: hypothetical protein LQ339_006271 [Xanthoria mediterranea]
MARSVTPLAHFLVLIFTGLLAFRDEVLPLSSDSPTNFSGLTEDCDPSKAGILLQINVNGFNGAENYSIGPTEHPAHHSATLSFKDGYGSTSDQAAAIWGTKIYQKAAHPDV